MTIVIKFTSSRSRKTEISLFLTKHEHLRHLQHLQHLREQLPCFIEAKKGAKMFILDIFENFK